jgi:hypothetical protein
MLGNFGPLTKDEKRDVLLYYTGKNDMTKKEALEMIDGHKNRLIDPTGMLHWTWLRVIISKIPDDKWEDYVEAAVETMSK